MKSTLLALTLVPTLSLVAAPFFSAAAAAPATRPAAPDAIAETARATIDKGFTYLKSAQKPDHSWQGPSDPPGVTALVLRAFMSDPRYDADQPFLEAGFDKLLSYQLDNGGIYRDALASYNTAIAISALALSKEPEYRAALDKAVAYLRGLQWTDEIQGMPPEKQFKGAGDPRFGGFGYGKRGRPDLSNTQIAVDALNDAGLKASDPAFQAALKFATRCQNASETNDQAWSGDDGGFVYTDAEGGDSNGSAADAGGGRKVLRSYGSMTYAGLKSMIYAGLGHDDSRVKAAWGWIGKHYTVDENPGLAPTPNNSTKGGLYYYFYTMARALRAYGEPTIVDATGTRHDWRVDLIVKLASLQKPDGSWAGEKRWMEDNPLLVTAYATQALEEAQKDLAERPAAGK